METGIYRTQYSSIRKKKKEATKSMSISPWQDQRARDEDGLLKNLRNRK